jgi:hypothetical protein
MAVDMLRESTLRKLHATPEPFLVKAGFASQLAPTG